jgi:hypothetical protein
VIIMQNKTFAIGILTLTAVVLGVANYFLSESNQAQAQVAIKDRDYSVVTGRTQTGADALYVLDSRTGQVAVLMYDAASQSVKPRKVRNLIDAFTPAR